MRAGQKPAKAVLMRGENQRVFLHGADQAGDGMTQDLGPLLAAIVKDIAPLRIIQREMHMHARAGAVAVRLGHEGRGETMFAGDAAHQPLEQHRVIGGLKRVIDMQQVDLELAGAVFGNRRIGGDAMRGAGVINLVQEGVEMLKFVQRQRAIRIQPLAGDR